MNCDVVDKQSRRNRERPHRDGWEKRFFFKSETKVRWKLVLRLMKLDGGADEVGRHIPVKDKEGHPSVFYKARDATRSHVATN